MYEGRREDVEKSFGALKQDCNDEVCLTTPYVPIPHLLQFVRVAIAYISYALDHPSNCLENTTLCQFNELQANGTGPTVLITSTDEKQTIAPTSIEDGKTWTFMQAIISSCLEGMAHEHLAPGSPSQALAAYDRGVRLLQRFTIPKSPNTASFTKYRELWRWTDRLLWRAIVLSAKHRAVEQTIPILRTYTLHSVHWPETFQSEHRSTICSLYLRALLLLSPNPDVPKATWTHEIRSVVNEYRAILTVTTHFPSAGERNVLVEEFVDYCVAAWESGGAIGDQAGWVIDVSAESLLFSATDTGKGSMVGYSLDV